MLKRGWLALAGLGLFLSFQVSATKYVPIFMDDILIIIPVDEAPYVSDDTADGLEDTPLQIDVLANDTDENISTVQLTVLAKNNHPSTVDIVDNIIHYMPPENWYGEEIIIYKLTDENGLESETAVLTITVAAVNDNPVAEQDDLLVNEIYSQCSQGGVNPASAACQFYVEPLVNDSDIEETSLTISAVSTPAHGQAYIEGNKIRFVPAQSLYSQETTQFSYTVSDGAGGTAEGIVNIDINHAPVITDLFDEVSPIPGLCTAEIENNECGVEFDPRAQATDPEGDRILVFMTSATPNYYVNGVEIPVERSYHGISWQASSAQYSKTQDPNLIYFEMGTCAYMDTYTAKENAGCFYPSQNATSNFRVVDSRGAISDIGSAIYESVAQKPVTSVDVITVNEIIGVCDAQGVITTDSRCSYLAEVLENDYDPLQTNLTLHSAGTSTLGAQVSIEGNQLRYIPSPQFYLGSDSSTVDEVDYTARSGSGTLSSSRLYIRLNKAPIVSNQTIKVQMTESCNGSYVDVTCGTTTSLRGVSDGETVSLVNYADTEFAGNLDRANHGDVQFEEPLTISYAPTACFYDSACSGTASIKDSFEVRVKDSSGAVSGISTVSVAIVENNVSPEAVADIVVIDEDSSISHDVIQNDIDANGDALSIKYGSVANRSGRGGNSYRAKVQFDTTIDFTPEVDENGDYVVEYTVEDGAGGSDIGQLYVVVRPVNDAPSFRSEPVAQAYVGEQYTYHPNIFDVEFDTVRFTILNQPAWTTFDQHTGTLTGKPRTADIGLYENIRITATDVHEDPSEQLSEYRIFSIQVSVNNTVPTINGTPTNTVEAGNSYSFAPTVFDADGDTLTFDIQNKPAWATFNQSNGQLSGTPQVANVGEYKDILISVSDGHSTASLPKFDLIVTGPPTIAISYPSNNAEVNGMSDVVVVADVKANGANITKVEFSLNGGPWVEDADSAAPWERTLENLDIQSYSIQARLTSDHATAATVTSAAHQFTVYSLDVPSLTIAATSNHDKVTVSWTDITSAAHYYLQEQYEDTGWNTLPKLTTNKKVLIPPRNGQYQYRVQACDANDLCTDFSTPQSYSVAMPLGQCLVNQ